jgi:hypothetical protein
VFLGGAAMGGAAAVSPVPMLLKGHRSMSSLHRLGTWFLAVGLLSAALPVRAADFDKYLLDDTDFVVTASVKQVAASPLFTKKFQKQVEGLLKMGPVAALLEGTGIDPLKDIDRITLISGRSCLPREGEYKGNEKVPSDAPLFVVQGNLDAAKVKTLLERAAKSFPVKVADSKVGDVTVWTLTAGDEPSYVAVPEKGVVIIAPFKEQAADAVERAAGKKKTMLKIKAMAGLLAKMDQKAAVSFAVSGDMAFTEKAVTFGKGDASKVWAKVKHHSLNEVYGLTSVTGSVLVADDIKGQATLNCKDSEAASALAKKAQDGLDGGIKFLSPVKEMAPLVDAMKSVKIKSQDKSVALEGQAKAEAIEGLIQMMVRAPSKSAPPKP